MSERSKIESVLSHYPGVVDCRIEALGGAGGFSGAALWKVNAGDTWLCLRRWPQEHPDRVRLQWIHDVLCHAADNGFAKLPTPIRSRDGQTFISVAEHFWELTRWMPGKANFHELPTSNRLGAVLVALARFHRSAESFSPQTGTPPGLVSRREQLDRLCAGEANQLSRSASTLAWPEFRQRAELVLRLFNQCASGTKDVVELASRSRVPLQPCIRDIWHDHVFFDGDEVAGFVDFGAMRVDHVACDISRLLGSLVRDNRAKWEQGLAAYQSLRPLTADELVLVDAYDRTAVLLSGMNWVQWIAVENRRFDDRQRVLQRMDEIIARLCQM